MPNIARACSHLQCFRVSGLLPDHKPKLPEGHVPKNPRPQLNRYRFPLVSLLRRRFSASSINQRRRLLSLPAVTFLTLHICASLQIPDPLVRGFGEAHLQKGTEVVQESPACGTPGAQEQRALRRQAAVHEALRDPRRGPTTGAPRQQQLDQSGRGSLLALKGCSSKRTDFYHTAQRPLPNRSLHLYLCYDFVYWGCVTPLSHSRPHPEPSLLSLFLIQEALE